MPSIAAEPYPFDLEPGRCALLIIDMQRDFLEPGGFGAALGNDVAHAAPGDRADPTRAGSGARAAHAGRTHARGAPRRTSPTCRRRSASAGASQTRIGDLGQWAAFSSAASPATTSSPSWRRWPASRWSTSPARARSTPPIWRRCCATAASRNLIVCGVTTEVCVNTTVREANDRGFDCLVLEDCVGSYFPDFQRRRASR